MPALTRVLVRTALVHLLLALTAGAALLAVEAVRGPGPLSAFRPVHVHLFAVGWLTQLVFGVAWWLFPRGSTARPGDGARLVWFAYAALNGGLALRAVAEPLSALRAGPTWAWLLVLSAVLQATAGWAFVVRLWPRVRGRAPGAGGGARER